MGSYSNGYHYNMPKRGNGYCLEWESGIIHRIVKKDGDRIKKELIANGYEEVELTKN